MDIDQVLTRLLSDSRCTVHRGAPKNEIAELEEQLELTIPEDYRTFLRRCGWVQVGVHAVFGLGPDAEKAANVLDNAFTEHLDYRGTDMLMPGHLLPVMNDGTGSFYCIDCGKAKSSRHAVVFWDHEHLKRESQKPKKVASGFAEWLGQLLDGDTDR